MISRRILPVMLVLLACSWAQAQTPSEGPNPYANETPSQRDARMKWWREARFGLFIHWGVYSVPAGVYKEKPIGGIGEWIMNSGKIPVSEYRAFAREFNPIQFNADEWVRMAKDAGMKYIVITSKHHDGFGLFDSKVTNWDIVDATPYGKDPLKDLAQACKKHGIRLGFYYSQAQDWNHPGGAAAGGHWDPAQDGNMDEYIQKIASPQVKEILSNYGKISILWWDTPVDMTQERADQLLPLIRLQPGIIVNNRLGGGYSGDSATPEQHIPATGISGDWETCMTMNDTWGFKKDDHNWKDVSVLIRNLVDIASKGGNYLLNVGPTSEGLIPQPSVERLQKVGEWMKVNGEAIYGTTASPFKSLTWGRCTKKLGKRGATLYLHVFDWPKDGLLKVPGLKNELAKAQLILSCCRSKLEAENTDNGVVIHLPAQAPDPIASVVVLKVRGELQVEPVLLGQASDGHLRLPASEAKCHGEKLQYESGGDRDNIGFWLEPKDWVSWDARISIPGTFKVSAEIAALQSATFELNLAGITMRAKAPVTGDYGRFQVLDIGEVKIENTGTLPVSVKPVHDGWQPINLKAVTLTPVK